VEELMIRTKIKFVIDIKNTMKKQHFNAVYNNQGKFYAVNGIGSIEEDTGNTVIDNL
jgi:hypothetical protein